MNGNVIWSFARMELIKEFHETVIPVMVFFIIINLFGFFGNLMIIYIYTFRYENNHFRRLVLCLSYVDIFSCCTTIPMETVSTWYWLKAPSRGLCKLKNFCVQFSALSAIYMLFVISLYKYLRICRQKQVTNKTIIIVFIVGICVALIFATPAAILWDINKEHVVLKHTNVTFHICEVLEEFRHTVYPVVYRSALSTFDLLLIGTIVLYIFVAKTIVTHIREKHRKAEAYKPKPNGVATTTKDDAKKIDANNDANTASGNTAKADRNLTESTSCQLSSAQIRKSVIMVILAGAFSVTFLMGLSFGYVLAFRDYKDFSSIGEIVGLFACYRLYFANYALNFLVYINLDKAFRSEVLSLFRLQNLPQRM